jgi:hypothetical protein
MIIGTKAPMQTEMLVEIETGPGAAMPVVQKVPITVVPRKGERISITGTQDRIFEGIVEDVQHMFTITAENRHTVWIKARKA